MSSIGKANSNALSDPKNRGSGKGKGRPKGSGFDLWARKFDRQRFHTRLDEFLEMNDQEFVAACQDANQFDGAIIALLIKIKRDQDMTAINTLWRMLGYIKRGEAAWDRDAIDAAQSHIAQPAAPVAVGEADLYIVEMNDNGKFVRARPRLASYVEGAATIDVKAK